MNVLHFVQHIVKVGGADTIMQSEIAIYGVANS